MSSKRSLKARKLPIKASPAPFVFITSIFGAGTREPLRPAPFFPKLSNIFFDFMFYILYFHLLLFVEHFFFFLLEVTKLKKVIVSPSLSAAVIVPIVLPDDPDSEDDAND